MQPSNKSQLPDFSVDIQNINRAQNTVKISLDPTFFSTVQRRTLPYKSLPWLFRPVLERIADYVRVSMIPQTFEREGPGWKPLARRTIAERIQAGYSGSHPILQRSRDLYKELTEKSHPRHIEIIKTGKNARIEIGGSSEKFIQNQLGVKEQRLPARPMIPGTGNLPLADRDRIAMRTIAINAIQEKLNARI